MEWATRDTTGAKEIIASSSNSMLRLFTVKKTASAVPRDEVAGEWRLADPKSVPPFSATGYYFARYLQEHLQRPAGFIASCWGGTTIQAWMSQDSLSKDPGLGKRSAAARDLKVNFPQVIKTYSDNLNRWASEIGRSDIPDEKPEAYSAAERPPGDWKPYKLSSSFTAAGLPDAGIVWLRKNITIPPQENGVYQAIKVGKISGFYTVYLNGTNIAEVTPKSGANSGWTYTSGSVIKAGPAVLAIRIYNPFGKNEIQSFGLGPIPVGNDWEICVKKAFPPVSPEALAGGKPIPEKPLGDSRIPGYLFDGMIHPLIPYALRGVIWYQGETDNYFGWQYRTELPLMIQSWREKWGRGDFSFYICQLANCGDKKKVPGDSSTAELREAQASALALPKTGLAVLLDLGEEQDVHFRNKSPVGERLGRLALNRDYGIKMADSGPRFKSSTVEGNRIRITFDSVEGGLVARPLPQTYQPRSSFPASVPFVRNSPGGELEGFAICGEDKKWVWADATIDKDTVLVSAPGVSKPVAVRYAWADTSNGNLYNSEGLPAGPFRTDEYPLPSASRFY